MYVKKRIQDGMLLLETFKKKFSAKEFENELNVFTYRPFTLSLIKERTFEHKGKLICYRPVFFLAEFPILDLFHEDPDKFLDELEGWTAIPPPENFQSLYAKLNKDVPPDERDTLAINREGLFAFNPQIDFNLAINDVPVETTYEEPGFGYYTTDFIEPPIYSRGLKETDVQNMAARVDENMKKLSKLKDAMFSKVFLGREDELARNIIVNAIEINDDLETLINKRKN